MIEPKRRRLTARASSEKRTKPSRQLRKRVAAAANTQRDDLASELQTLGFSDYEARAYMALLHLGPATAYEVSKAAGLPRANTYGALESCTDKGAVQPFSQNPFRYVPVDPQELLSQIADDTTARCHRLASRLSRFKVGQDREFVWNIEGEQRVHAKISEIISTAKLHVWIKADESVIDAHHAELRDAAARGVKILIILFGADGRRFQFNENVSIYLHEGNGVRIGSADNLFTITTDFKIALTAKMHGDIYAAYTRSEPIVTMGESLIRHDLYLAQIFERFGPEIDKAFGPFLMSLRRSYFSPEQLLHLNEMLDRVGATAGQAPPAIPKRAAEHP